MVSYIAPTQAVKVSPKTTYNQTPSQVQLSPETKSTLTSGLMASILGATWFAPTKIKGADELMQVSPDIFEITTKKASQMAQNTNERQAYEGLKALRDFVAKQKTTSVNNLFGNKTEMSVKELFNKIDPRIKTVSRADKIAEALAQRAEKFNLFSIFPHPETLTNGITNEHFIALDKLIPDKSSKQLVAFKNAFKQKFPKGTKFTTEELLEFIKPHINQLGQKKETLEIITRIASSADSKNIITKNTADKILHRYTLDTVLDSSKELFEVIKSKLPKARIKGAIKWFGLGIAISILSNSIFGIIGNKKNTK